MIARTAFAAAILIVGAAAWAVPEFVLSGRLGDLEKGVVAQTPAGPLTALDILLYDQMTEQALWQVPIEALLDPKTLAAERHLPAIRAAIDRCAVAHVLAARAGGWAPAADEVRVLSYPAAQAAWLDLAIAPSVKVEEADIHRYYLEHANDYLRRRQIQVRYIFRRVDPKDAAAMDEARRQLETISLQVREAGRDFAQAARDFSQASSAAQGGLLPLFYDSTYFPAFEQYAFNLEEPGQLSPVFDGEGGLYLLQLVESRPQRNIPLADVHDEIGRILAASHIEHYFRYELGKLKERQYIQDFSPYWAHQNVDAPVAIVGPTRLARQDFIRYYGNATDLNYNVLWDVVGGGIADWIDGELIMQQIEGQAAGQHRWLRRSHELAAVALRARHTLAAEVPAEGYATPEAAAASLGAADASRYFRTLRLLAFDFTPVADPALPASEQRKAQRLAQYLEDQLRLGTLQTEPAPIDMAVWRADAATSSPAALTSSIKSLDDAVAAAPWTNVKVKVRDIGWQTPLPGEPLALLLVGVEPGGFSRAQVTGPTRTVYYAVDGTPARLEGLRNQPVLLRQLAFQAAGLRIRDAELEKLKSQNAIQYQF